MRASSTPGRSKSRDLLIILDLRIGESARFPLDEQNNIRNKLQRHKGRADDDGVIRNYVTRADKQKHYITVTRI